MTDVSTADWQNTNLRLNTSPQTLVFKYCDKKGQNYGKAKDSKYTHTDTTLDLAALRSVSQIPEIQYSGPSFADTVLLFIMSTAYTSESRKFGENNQMMDAPG